MSKRENLKQNQKDFYVKVLPEEEDNINNGLSRWPTFCEVVEEIKILGAISLPMVVTGLLFYSRAAVSTLFLGRLGEAELAGGSLAICFANITGYSVMSGLAMGMEPICSQSYGAKRWGLLGLTLQRTILILLISTLPITFLWINMERIFLFLGQDQSITKIANTYILFTIPDLLAQAFLHPLRIYLRTQSIILPLACSAFVAMSLHVPVNFLLVIFFNMGIEGVALAAAWTNFNLVLILLCYLWWSGIYKNSWEGFSMECFSGLMPLIKLAIPSCASVCLEWWWYEFMVVLSGLLTNPKATMASMGILIQTTALIYIFPSALSVGVSTRVGNELGANRAFKARYAMIMAISCAFILGFIAMIFANSIRHAWAKLFTHDPDILKLTSTVLPILGLCELFNCPQTTGCGVLRGSARPSLGATINLGSFYLIGMPIALSLSFFLNMGFIGLWLGLLAAQASCLIFMLYNLFRTDWNLQGERAIQLTGAKEFPDYLVTESKVVIEIKSLEISMETETELLIETKT